MGKYMRKAKIAGEVAVMELSQAPLGVRTRAKTLALQRLQNSTPSSSSYLQLRSRRLEKPPFVAAAANARKAKEACRDNPRVSDRSLLADSAISGSVGSVSLSHSRKAKDAAAADTESLPENIEPAGTEASCGDNVLEIDGKERFAAICMNIRETTPSSLVRDPETQHTPTSTSRPTNSTASNRRIRRHRNIPTAREIEEFFACAEQEQQRLFTEKYNYDPVNDLPVPGRYAWVRLDQCEEEA
ncbi:hypothetical protein ACLOJK_007900 [Asimina triloba]